MGVCKDHATALEAAQLNANDTRDSWVVHGYAGAWWCDRYSTFTSHLPSGAVVVHPEPYDVEQYINSKLYQGKCPGDSAWGECAAISNATGHYGNAYQIAIIYWWKSPPQAGKVLKWITEAGYSCYSIENVLWQDDGSSPEDNEGIVATWNVSFGPKVGELEKSCLE